MDTSAVSTTRELRSSEKLTNLSGLISKDNLETKDWQTLMDNTGLTY